jgi:hypothetical protein
MRAIEFHFNPDNKTELIFDSFCCSPENIYEKRMGGLFMLGEIKNPLPHNYKLLEKTAGAIKKEFYSKFQRTHEQALKEALKRGNDFLSQEVSRENTDWLGNFSFAIISLKNFDLNFTKVGNIKMFLIRGPHVIDIGSKLDSQEIEPYPLKIFNNIVSGKVGESDIILAISESIFPKIKSIISEINGDEKKLKNLLKAKEDILADAVGSFLVINVAKTDLVSRNQKIVFRKEPEKFAIKNSFLSLAKYYQKITAVFKKLSTLFARKKPAKEEPVIPPSGPIKVKVKIEQKKPSAKLAPLKLPAFSMPVFRAPLIKLTWPKIKLTKKNLESIGILVLFLVAGFLIFQGQEKQKQKEYLAQIQTIQENVSRAENYLAAPDKNPETKNQALILLSDAWSNIIPLTKMDGQIKKSAVLLKTKIDDDLKNLSNMTMLDEPETIFQFNKEVFIPQKLVFDEKNLYFFSPYVQNIFQIDENKNGQIVTVDQKFNEAAEVAQNNILFFSSPDKITSLENGQIKETLELRWAYSNADFSDLTVFKDNVYFLDSSSGEITKYSLPIAENYNSPQKWFWLKTFPRPDGGKSLAVDGSLWVLDKNNNFLKYYAGSLQETITPDIFPAPKNFSKIIIPYGSPYIFVLEPAQKRVVIFEKTGKVFKQYESKKFDSLLDFAVSQDGQIIFLLNGLKVYKINL